MRTTIPWQTDVESPHQISELAIEPTRTALIVVDVQNYSPSNWKIAPNCVKLRSRFAA